GSSKQEMVIVLFKSNSETTTLQELDKRAMVIFQQKSKMVIIIIPPLCNMVILIKGIQTKMGLETLVEARNLVILMIFCSHRWEPITGPMLCSLAVIIELQQLKQVNGRCIMVYKMVQEI